MAAPQAAAMHFPPPGAAAGVVPPAGPGPSKLWVLQGFNSPTTPGGALNGVTRDFANVGLAPKTPKTPKTPKWGSIWDGVLRKIVDSAHYGNALGLDGSAEEAAAGQLDGTAAIALERAANEASLSAQAVHDLLASVVGAHLPAWKAFLSAYLRAVPSSLPASPNPLAISGPIPPLSQQHLLGALGAFLSTVLLPHQLAQVVGQWSGQNHYIIGRVLAGAGFPVETSVQGAAVGGACGLRLHASNLSARMFVFRAFTAALQARQAAQRLPAAAPIFYLSPSFAAALGYPECLPRLCWELGLTPDSFKVLPLAPCMDESVLASLPRAPGTLEAREREGEQLQSSHSGGGGGGGAEQPNPFLAYGLDLASLEHEVGSDAAAAARLQSQSQSGVPAPFALRVPAAVFATAGNVAGLDLPYESDDLAAVGALARRYGMQLHVEGTSLFAGAPENRAQAATTASSVLFEAADSVLLYPGQWVGQSNGPVALALRNPSLLPAHSPARDAAAHAGFWSSLPQHSSCLSALGGGSPSGEEFSAVLALWFNLIQIHPGSFSSLLARLSAKQRDKVALVRRVLTSQAFPAFVAPAGEDEGVRAAYLSRVGGGAGLFVPPAPSHPHLFVQLGLPAPWGPGDFHMDRSALNGWLSARLSARISSKAGDYAAYSRVFGLSLTPVQHFDRVGLLYCPAPVSIWTQDGAVEEELALLARLLSEAVGGEMALLEQTARLRVEFEELLQAEAPEFAYVPAGDVARAAGLHPGLGAVRFIPASIPEQHLEEVGALFNEAISRTSASFHHPAGAPGAAVSAPAPAASPPSAQTHSWGDSLPQSSGLVSMYRPGRTVSASAVGGGGGGAASSSSSVCCVLELSELVVRKGLRAVLAELKAAAARLDYPAHIQEDVESTLRQGIRAAEEKITSRTAESYRPSSVLRWVPLVGSMLNWVAPPAAEQGQSFDMKRKELSSIKYSYSSSGGAAGGAGAGAGAGASSTAPSRTGSSSSLSSMGGAGTNNATPAPGSTPAGALFSPLSINHSAPAPAASTSAIPSATQQSSQQQQPSIHTVVTPPILTLSPSLDQSRVTSQTASAQQGIGKRPPPALVTGATPQYTGSPTEHATIPASAQQGASGRPPLPPTTGVQPFGQVPVHVSQPAFQGAQPQQLTQQQQQQNQFLQQHQQLQQQQQAAAPQQSQQPQSRALPPVKVTLDEADRSFVPLLNAAPRSLGIEQLALLTRGEQFLAYFPQDPEPSAVGAAGAAPAATSVTKLCLFLEPSYAPSQDEALELGVAPGAPVSLLCWCEPGVPRYVKTDQAVAVEQVSALHLGASSLFPRQAVRGSCFSLVTAHVQLHLEAPDNARRRDWFLALYTLVSQAPAHSVNGGGDYDAPQQPPPQQQQQPAQQLGLPRPSSSSSNSVSPPSGAGVLSPAEDEAALRVARGLLESGSPFVVYVLDKHDAELTTRHEVLLWYRPAQAANAATGAPALAHSLCWCRRGGGLDFSPARSLPLNKTVQICMGKQTKAFKNTAASGADPAAAFSVMVEKMILNLEASSADDRASWLSAFHTVMSAAGKKRVFDAESGAAGGAQAGANNTQEQQRQ